jgi:hypothetical protein
MGIIRETYDDGNHTSLNKLKYSEYGQREPIIIKEIPHKGDSKAPTTNNFTRRVDDFTRIATILTQPPGLRYLGNETMLNIPKVDFKTKLKKDGSVSKLGTLVNAIGANLLSTVKIIGSTLAQVPLNGTGTHFVKGFDGVGKRVYLDNLQTSAHKLALFNGKVFEDNILPEGYNNVWRNPGMYREIPEDEFMATSTMPDSSYTKFHPSKEALKRFFKEGGAANKEGRFNLGKPGKRLYFNDITAPDEDTIDKKNQLGPVDSTSKDFEIPKEAADIIKFHFEVITPKGNTMLFFRAFLDTLSDAYSANWTPIQYIGRGESFYSYDNSTRSINLGFKISAQSRQEMRPLYQKINFLASSTSPSYTAAGFQTPTFVNVTVGDYLEEVPCIVNNVNYNWNQNYNWEIAKGGLKRNDDGSKEWDAEIDYDVQELPQTLDCTLQLTPLHSFLPQTGNMPFIGSSQGGDKGFVKADKDGGPGTLITQPTQPTQTTK